MYRTSITGLKISLLLFLLIVSCTTKSDTTTMAIVYNLNGGNFIFYINGSYYLPFSMQNTNLSEEKIESLFPNVTTETILLDTGGKCVQYDGEDIFFANNILCKSISPICDVYINNSQMSVHVFDKDDNNRHTEFSLKTEELLFIEFLKDKLQGERQCVYIDSTDINESSCNYQYMILLDSDKGEKKIFVSGKNPNEPTSCAMLSDFIVSLVQKRLTNVHQNIDESQICSENLKKARIILNQLESDYHIVPEIPIWKDMQSITY